MAKPTEDLQNLINEFSRGVMELSDFKKEAMPLIQNGADPYVLGTINSCYTLLHCLILSNKNGVNDQEITEILGLKKEPVNAQNAYGRTALTSLIDQFQSGACTLEDFKRSSLLLAKHGAKLTDLGSKGSYNTLLHCLILSNQDGVNDQEITKILDLNTEIVNAQNAYGRTALTSLIDQFQSGACKLGDFKRSALLLVKHGAKLTDLGSKGPYYTLLHCLILSNQDGVNDQEITEVLGLKKEIVNAQNAYGRTTLTSLIDQFQSDECKLGDFKRSALLLVRHGAKLTDLGSKGSYNTLLHCLILSNQDGVNDQEITEILDLKKEIVNAQNAYGRTVLTSLINQFQSGECKLEDFKRSALLLAKHGAKLTDLGSKDPYHTLLHCLILSNQDGVNDNEIAALVKLKSDIFTVENAYGYQPIQFLLIKQPTTSLDVVKKLIDVGSALKYINSDGENLVHISSRIGNLELAQYLAHMGVEVTNKTKQDMTSLHYSASSNNPALWQWLLDNKVDIDAQNSRKQTALHSAVLNNNTKMVQWLIEHDADIYIRNFHGNTALSLAKTGQQEIMNLLIAAEITPKGGLLSKIHTLKEYGAHLKEQGAFLKGQVAEDLAKELNSKADAYFKQKNTEDTFKAFQKEFSQILHSKDQQMSEYRTNWSTIIANIGIALTGIGAFFLAGHLICTKVTQGRALFFFQKSKTTGEENIDKVDQAMMGLGG